MCIFMNRMFRRYYRFIEVHIALFIHKAVYLSLWGGEILYNICISWAVSTIIASFYLISSEILLAILITLSSEGFSL